MVCGYLFEIWCLEFRISAVFGQSYATAWPWVKILRHNKNVYRCKVIKTEEHYLCHNIHQQKKAWASTF